MTEPRIYTYKITFPNQGWWYWGAHKEKKGGEEYNGSPKVHSDKWSWFEYEKQILEYHDTWEDCLKVEARLIMPDLNNPMCLNEGCMGEVSELFKESKRWIYAPASEKQKKAASKTGKVWSTVNFHGSDMQSELGKRVFDKKVGIFDPAYEEEKKAWNSKGGKQGKGKKWFNDSKSETLAYECPIGHKKGRLPR